MEEVVLVNESDVEVGRMEKLEAHKKGLLHRAFSVFIFDSMGNMLLQQRARGKYHSAGLWSNACCSHPRPGEDISASAVRRLQEEMGFTTKLEKIFEFTYKANLDNALIENEFDHVLAGIYEGPVLFNKEEVMAVQYIRMNELKKELEDSPAGFTVWFRIAFPKIETWWNNRFAPRIGKI